MGGLKVIKRYQNLQIDELGIFGQVVGEHVGGLFGYEPGGQLAPVVVPPVLGDPDLQPRFTVSKASAQAW